MEIKILGQGYESTSKDSVGSNLIELFSKNDFHTFFGVSAFTSQSAINGLSAHINNAKKHLKTIAIITGVNYEATSKEALLALLNLNIKSFIYYERPSPIFHPKIYLFEGKEKSVLIIGSSNLTTNGLFANVEASLRVDIDNDVKDDCNIIVKLKEYYKGLFDFTDPNISPVTVELIGELVSEGIVPTEAEQKAIRSKIEKGEKKSTNSIISRIFPKRAIAKVPPSFRNTSKKVKVVNPIITTASSNKTQKGALVWTRKKLPASSVQISATGTNPTGGLRLVQDDFVVSGKKINQTTYFRSTLFGQYVWKQIRSSPLVEATTVPFEVTIKGKNIGQFNLEVRHKPSGEAGQGNYTTSISWGQLGEIIRKSNLVGERLDMYSPSGKNKFFHIVIS